MITLLSASAALAERPANIDTSRTDATTFRYGFSRGQVSTAPFEFSETEEGLGGTIGGTWTLDLSMTVRHEVQSVSDAGVASLGTSLSAIAGSIDVYGDSADMAEVRPIFEAARISLNADSLGNVTERRDAISDIPDSPEMTSDVTDALRTLWITYPEEPVAIGDSWLETIPMSDHDPESGFSSNIIARYTLAGFASGSDGQVAVIDVQYTSEISGSLDLSENGSRVVQVVGRGNGEGYALVAPSTGRLQGLHVERGAVLTITQSNGQRATRALTSVLSYGTAIGDADGVAGTATTP